MAENKRYKSVSELVRATVEDPQCADDFDALSASRSIISSLMALRAARGMSQADIAGRLGCSQSRISKMEAGKDLELSLGDLANYAEAVGYDINLALVDNTQPLVERIKYHAITIGNLLEKLVKLAHHDQDIARGVTGFFGEAFFNLLNILKKSSDAMPTKEDGTPLIKIDVIGPVAIKDKGMRSTRFKASISPPETREAATA